MGKFTTCRTALGLLVFFINSLWGMTIHNGTRRPVAVACVQTVFKIGDLHNKLYVAPDTTIAQVIDRTRVHLIPPGQYITAPLLGPRSFLRYGNDLWASYSFDHVIKSITEPEGRNPYVKTVFYYNVGSGKNPIHIVENRNSRLSFVIESSSNRTTLQELEATVAQPRPDAKKFNRLMRLLAIPFKM